MKETIKVCYKNHKRPACIYITDRIPIFILKENEEDEFYKNQASEIVEMLNYYLPEKTLSEVKRMMRRKNE